jgi:sulfide:quinone oxidoreductase
MASPNQDERPRVLIAGGGVAALEASLLMRAYVSEADVDIDVLTPALHFSYRPLSVLESFGEGPAWSMPLHRFAADQDVTPIHDALRRVLPDERAVETTSGSRYPYDALLVAIGGAPTPQIPGAITLQGSTDAPAVRRVLDDAAARLRPRVVFAVGAAPSWPLPLYELALLTAGALSARGSRAEITLVTPEERPLEVFGTRASDAVSAQLDRHGIETITNAEPLAMADGELRLADGRAIAADRVIALPRVVGRFIDGLPQDRAGFVAVDSHGRVPDRDGVYAAGDITTFPFKQGGLATQQADAAAEAILADLGLPIEPRPFSPVLQGVLLSDGEPAYLRRPLGEGAAEASAPRTYCLWWPPSKIAGRFLSPYLTVRAGAPRAPEVRPGTDIVPVRLDVAQAIAAGAGPVPAD